MILEQFRLSCTTEYVVGEDGQLYRLPYIDANGWYRVLKVIKPFLHGRKHLQRYVYDIRIDGKMYRFSKNQLIKYYVEVPKKKRRILVLQDVGSETTGIPSSDVNADVA